MIRAPSYCTPCSIVLVVDVAGCGPTAPARFYTLEATARRRRARREVCASGRAGLHSAGASTGRSRGAGGAEPRRDRRI